MAQAKVLVKRRKSVRNTEKITRTMEMVSTVRYKQAHGRIASSGPYQEKLRELLAGLLKDGFPGLVVHGEDAPRLPNTLACAFPGIPGQDAVDDQARAVRVPRFPVVCPEYFYLHPCYPAMAKGL